jgi:hypothetical protein
MCIVCIYIKLKEHKIRNRHWWRSTGTGGAVPALVAQTGTGGAVPALVAQYRHW